MKKISKMKIDSLVYVTSSYWATGDKRLLNARMAIVKMIQEESGITWGAILNFVDGILMCDGLAPEADNQTIYNALQLFGWDVVE
jgi:hypothetical protein